MLTKTLINLAHRKPHLCTCPFCKSYVNPQDPQAEYIKSKRVEYFFHRNCFIKQYKESLK